MEPYRRSRKIRWTALGSTLVLCTAAGLVLGGLAYVVGQIYYAVLLFPVVLSLAAVVVVRWSIRMSRLHNQWLAVLCALWIGLVIYGTMRYTNYVVIRRDAIRDVVDEYQVSRERAAEAVDRYWSEESGGAGGFLAFLELQASGGVTFTSFLAYNGSVIGVTDPVKIHSAGAWLYWLLELGIICSLPVLAASIRSGQQFSEADRDWYGDMKQYGNVEISKASQFILALKSDDFEAAGKDLIPGEKFTHPIVEVYTQRCNPKGKGNFLLTLKETWRDRTGRVRRKLIFQGELATADFERLIRNCPPVQ